MRCANAKNVKQKLRTTNSRWLCAQLSKKHGSSTSFQQVPRNLWVGGSWCVQSVCCRLIPKRGALPREAAAHPDRAGVVVVFVVEKMKFCVLVQNDVTTPSKVQQEQESCRWAVRSGGWVECKCEVRHFRVEERASSTE